MSAEALAQQAASHVGRKRFDPRERVDFCLCSGHDGEYCRHGWIWRRDQKLPEFPASDRAVRACPLYLRAHEKLVSVKKELEDLRAEMSQGDALNEAQLLGAERDLKEDEREAKATLMKLKGQHDDHEGRVVPWAGT